MFSKTGTKKSIVNYWEQIDRLREAFKQADAVVIGAGSGLSASAGFTYSGERFQKYFADFAEAYADSQRADFSLSKMRKAYDHEPAL